MLTNYVSTYLILLFSRERIVSTCTEPTHFFKIQKALHIPYKLMPYFNSITRLPFTPFADFYVAHIITSKWKGCCCMHI